MNYDMTKPCEKCPFRTDCPKGWLGASRAAEIAAGITTAQQSFPCHKTIEFDDDGENKLGNKSEQHCAGALILLEKLEQPNQMMRICERLGLYDRTKLDMEQPVFDTVREFIKHHGGKRGKATKPPAVEPEGESG